VQWFLATLLVGFAVWGATFALLAHGGRLPPPPLTSSLCMNEKLRFLREHDLSQVQVLAVGSSATARNLDMGELSRGLDGATAMNAATCFIRMHQIAWYTRQLLAHASATQIVVVVAAPRDFEACPAHDEAWVSGQDFKRYVVNREAPWSLYATHLSVRWLGGAWRFARASGRIPEVELDTLGSMPMRVAMDWHPPPRFDDRCFAALARLERIVGDHGARLLFVHFPVHPDWALRHDPNHERVDAFRQRVRTTLVVPSTRVVDGDAARLGLQDFADGVHLLWPSVPRFSRFVAESIGHEN
jgi:hypothetical protein